MTRTPTATMHADIDELIRKYLVDVTKPDWFISGIHGDAERLLRMDDRRYGAVVMILVADQVEQVTSSTELVNVLVDSITRCIHKCRESQRALAS